MGRREAKLTAHLPLLRGGEPEGVFHDPSPLPPSPQAQAIPPRLVKGAKADPDHVLKARSFLKTGVGLSEVTLANITSSSQRPYPHPSHLPSFSGFPSLGGQDRRDTPDTGMEDILPPSSLLPTTQLEGGREERSAGFIKARC